MIRYLALLLALAVAEFDRCFGVLARAPYRQNGTYAEHGVLDALPHLYAC